MALHLREGAHGSYYGSFFDESDYMSIEQMQVNASYLYKALTLAGWSKNAIAAILGNMQAESNINPGVWQSHLIGNREGGYGLVQWTPASKYIDWVTGDPSEMDNNISRILYELENNIQWIATDTYDFSFKEFSKSNESPQLLASAFLKNYERAGIEVEEERRANAAYWYAFIEGEPLPETPGTGGATTRKKKRFKFVLFRKN